MSLIVFTLIVLLALGNVQGSPIEGANDPLLEQHPYLVDIGVINGKHFYTNESMMTWRDANKFCHELGIHWGRIENIEENNLVVEYINETRHFTIWLSASDLLIEGMWKWGEDNSPLTFANWGANEPGENTEENCAVVAFNGDWIDGPCDSTSIPLCYAIIS